uniref:Mab-21-like HhH/H2TH-like domain-containing protein n=2 Tax=Magallana gigas TaxID=29159 RepID=A0A8W8I376_MAGGI
MGKGLSSERYNPLYINPKKCWDQLQLVIGTEEDVHIRREVNALYVYAFCLPSCREYLSGSKGEGFLFPWSDLDIMVSKLPPEEISMESFHNDCAYIATTNGCKPGFCKLIQSYAKCDYYSRVEFLQLKQHAGFNVNFDQTIRGPCYSTNFPDGFDCCYALPVHPDSSNVFLRTFKTKFWNGVKLEIMNKNITVMHCVPKGPEKGDDDGHQWLISFSILEQNIVHSLNHVQFCCYGLMKVIIHVVIDICAEIHDTVSSYHLKTVLFHVIEDIHPEFWISQNIFYCLRICLTRLLLFVMRGYCPSYFIPENNLFSKPRMAEKRRIIQENLLDVLQCENALMYCIICIQVPSEKNELQNESRKVRTFYSLCLALRVVNGHQTTYRECINSVLKIMVALQGEEDQLRIAILKYLWLLIMRRIGVIMYDKFVLTGFESYLLSAEVALMFAQHANNFGSIYLATLWYCEGGYKQCIKLVSKTKKNLPTGLLKETVYLKSVVNKCRKGPCNNTSLFENHYVNLTVELHRTSHLFPKDLKELVEKATISEFIVYYKSYAYFLLFLCYYTLHKRTECINVYSELLKSYREYPFRLAGNLLQRNTKKILQILR